MWVSACVCVRACVCARARARDVCACVRARARESECVCMCARVCTWIARLCGHSAGSLAAGGVSLVADGPMLRSLMALSCLHLEGGGGLMVQGLPIMVFKCVQVRGHVWVVRWFVRGVGGAGV